MRRLCAIITSLFFIVYAHGTVVMWTLYQFERHDIVMYYCAPGDTPEGFVETLSDATDNGHGAVLVKTTAGTDMYTMLSPQTVRLLSKKSEYVMCYELPSFFQSILWSPPTPPPEVSIS